MAEINHIKVVKVENGVETSKVWEFDLEGQPMLTNLQFMLAESDINVLAKLHEAGAPVYSRETYCRFLENCILKAEGIDVKGMMGTRGPKWGTDDERAQYNQYVNGIPYQAGKTKGTIKKEAKIIESAIVSQQKALEKAEKEAIYKAALEEKMIPIVADKTLDQETEEKLVAMVKDDISKGVKPLDVKVSLAKYFGTGNMKRIFDTAVPPQVIPCSIPSSITSQLPSN